MSRIDRSLLPPEDNNTNSTSQPLVSPQPQPPQPDLTLLLSNSNNTQNPTATPIPPSSSSQHLKHPSTSWQTKMIYEEGLDTKELLFGMLCFHCAQAKAKTDLDGTNTIYNCFCWHHGMTYAWIRSVYGIKSNCGSDLMSAIFCSCCAGRRILSEVRIRGKQHPQQQAIPSRADIGWTKDIFGCSTCSFIQTLLFPCCVGHDVRVMLQQQQQTEDEKLDCCFDSLCINPCAMYGQVRHTYQLPAQFLPPVVEDVCMAFVLFPCALDQTKRELRDIKKG